MTTGNSSAAAGAAVAGRGGAAAAAALVLAVVVGRRLPIRPEPVHVQIELPEGTTLARECQLTVVRAPR